MKRGGFRRTLVVAAWVVIAAVASGVSTVGSSVAGAATAQGWGIGPYSSPGQPARAQFDIVAKPGQSLSDAFTISNFTDHPISFNLYSADAYNTTVGDAFALKLANEQQVGVGKWVSLPTSKLTVAAQQSDRIDFALTVPRNATPGDHAGGIVAQNTQKAIVKRNGVEVPVLEGVGVRIFVRVSGKIQPGLAVADLHASSNYGAFTWATGSAGSTVQFDAVNTGNVELNAKATVEELSWTGAVLHTFKPTSLPVFLPGNRVHITEPAVPLPHLGQVHFKVVLTAGRLTASQTATLWLIPWVLILIIVLLLALVVLLWVRRRRRRRRTETGGGPGRSGGSDAAVGAEQEKVPTGTSP